MVCWSLKVSKFVPFISDPGERVGDLLEALLALTRYHFSIFLFDHLCCEINERLTVVDIGNLQKKKYIEINWKMTNKRNDKS